MNIIMVGIDYQKASIEYRERFSFTAVSSREAMQFIRDKYHVKGCVIFSTCNRTELWINGLDQNINAAKILCEIKNENYEELQHYFYEFENREAVSYLLELACGVHSLIWGEDQILTQVKKAIDYARECACTDNVLEKLFQTAVTAAKKVKTMVKLTHANQSVSTKVVDILTHSVGSLKGVSCLVIGNGEMGKLMADTLVKEECDVTITTRKYKTGEVLIPDGCKSISYDDRISFGATADIIISATLSPHYTIKYDEAALMSKNRKNCYYFDLAVPRDIEQSARNLPNVQLFDVDSLGGNESDMNEPELRKAKEILMEYEEEFEIWYRFKELVPIINNISEKASIDINNRVKKTIYNFELDSYKRAQLENDVEIAVQKVVSGLMYGLKNHLDKQLWNECFMGLQSSCYNSNNSI